MGPWSGFMYQILGGHVANRRTRRIGSIKTELLRKSREAALAAVQVFNNPNISFKTESYIVLMIIAWTYLMHAYYRSISVDYRYYSIKGTRKKYSITCCGAHKYWELERCLNSERSPIDKNTSQNLRFLIGLRHEIEHQMTTRIDDILSARFQACCLNYNQYIKMLFSEKYGIEKHLSFSLQFSTISTEQRDLLLEHKDLPKNIQSYIVGFDDKLTEEEYNSQQYAYRILFVPKTANRKGQADRVIEFVPSNSPLAEAINKEYAFYKETEKKKYLPQQIVDLMISEGFGKFSIYHHTQLWKSLNAQDRAKGYGTVVADKQWHWYERWVDVVRTHCKDNAASYSSL